MLNDPDNKPDTRIGVVLVNWNSDEVTIPCVESLVSGSRVPDCIVIVDNGSRPESVENIIAACPTAHIIRNRNNYGFTGGNNAGLAYLLEKKFDYAWILNNDTEVDPDCLAVLANSLDVNHDAAAVTGKIYSYGTDRLLWFAGATYARLAFRIGHRGLGEIDNGQYDHEEKIDFFDGCSLLIRCEVLQEVGLFDNHYFAYHEDLDLAFRISKRGFSMFYNPQALLYHKTGISIGKNTRRPEVGGTSTPVQHFLINRNHIYVARRYAGLAPRLVSIVSLVLQALYLTPALVLLNRKAKVHAVWSGIFHGIFDDIRAIQTEPQEMPY